MEYLFHAKYIYVFIHQLSESSKIYMDETYINNVFGR